MKKSNKISVDKDFLAKLFYESGMYNLMAYGPVNPPWDDMQFIRDIWDAIPIDEPKSSIDDELFVIPKPTLAKRNV